MTYLPDTDQDEKNHEEERRGEASKKGGTRSEAALAEPERGTRSEAALAEPENGGRFGTGFLAGCLLTLICAAVFMAGWMLARQSLNGGTGENPGAAVLTDKYTLSKLDEVQSLIEQNFLDEVDSETLSAYLFRGVAAGLDDDYAGYYTADELQSLREATEGEYFGIGAVLTYDAETEEIRVTEVYEDSPAHSGGLQEGDVLISVDGNSLEGVGVSDAVSMIKGQGDTFVLEVYRPDTEETLALSMACSEVEPTYVTAEMKTDRLGYIRISEFTQSAVGQFSRCLDSLKEQGMETLLVDLRGNPGGLLDSVCDILDELLPERLLVYTENKAGRREEYYSDEEQAVDCTVAVLVNGDSASASEIFAGAVQDWELGPVIGAQTYGKGVVQKTYQLSDGSAMKFTVAKYYTPNGQNIDGNGITPDIPVEEPEEETGDIQGDAQAESGDARKNTQAESGKDENVDELSDPVLDRAIDIMREWE